MEFAIIDGKPQWKERGADSFSPFSNAKLVKLGTGTSFNISSVVGAENISKYSASDFVIVPNLSSHVHSHKPSDMTSVWITDVYAYVKLTRNASASYNNKTGVVTITNMQISNEVYTTVRQVGSKGFTYAWDIPSTVYLCVK